MTIYYVEDNADLAAVVTSTGDTVLLKSGVTFAVAAIPATLLNPSNVTLGYYGSGERPIISGGTIRADWTYDAVNNVYSRAYVAEKLGNVTEDGVPMRFVQWDTDLATTAAKSAMTSARNGLLWSGAMTFDPATNVLYIRPSSGVAADHEYIVSDAGTSAGNGIPSAALNSGLVIRDIELRNVSRHGILLYNKRGLLIQNVVTRVIGGAKDASYYLGNGVEISYGCHDHRVIDCAFFDTFDSGATTQLYESTVQFLCGGHYENTTVARYGMHGIELSVQSAAQHIIDIEIAGVSAEDGGANSWAGDRNGAVVTCLSNAPGSSRVHNAFARDVKAARCKRLYLGYQHGGVCGIEDSVAEGNALSATGNANGVTGQSDLYRAITDSAGAPSGMSAVTANLAGVFAAYAK